MSNNKGLEDLFYSQAELLNFALHKCEVDVYEIIETEDNKYIYAVVKEINKSQLEKLDKCGFPFFCIDSYYSGIAGNLHAALWIQFRNTFD